MRLDHVSYAASHDQVIDVIQRIGSRLNGTFFDGGIHPRFGTRNFILPLMGRNYIEVVSPVEHPVLDDSPFGNLVRKRVSDGGGWLAWVCSTNNINEIEKTMARKSIESHRLKPNGSEVKWKQLGVIETLNNSELPFFIEWETEEHPSQEGFSNTLISEIEFQGDKLKIDKFLGQDCNVVLNPVRAIWKTLEESSKVPGIISVSFSTINGIVKID